MISNTWQTIKEKYYWIHFVFWFVYSIYLFANPALYKWGIMPVIYTAIAFYLTYGGAYLFTVKVTAPRFFVKRKIGSGLLLILLAACLQQALFAPISNYFLPFNNPFIEWFLFNLPFLHNSSKSEFLQTTRHNHAERSRSGNASSQIAVE